MFCFALFCFVLFCFVLFCLSAQRVFLQVIILKCVMDLSMLMVIISSKTITGNQTKPANQIKSNQIKSNQIKSNQIKSNQTKTDTKEKKNLKNNRSKLIVEGIKESFKCFWFEEKRAPVQVNERRGREEARNTHFFFRCGILITMHWQRLFERLVLLCCCFGLARICQLFS